MAHVEHGSVAYIEQIEHVLLKRALEIRVERAHGLIEHKDARMRRHHARKRHALLLTAREAHGVAVDKVGQTENAQITLGELFARGGVARVLYTGAYVIGHRHVGKQLIVLEQQGAFSLLGRQVDTRRRVKKGHAVDYDLALVGRLHAGNAAQRAALAATRGAQQRHTLLAGIELNVENKPGITFLNIQNERHSLSTSLCDRVIAHELGQRLAIDTQGITTRRIERIALSGEFFGLPALRAGQAALAVLLRMRRIHIDE